MGWLRLGAAILAIVAVTGLVSVPGGIGGPTTSPEHGGSGVTGAAGEGNETLAPAVAERFDGPDDTIRVTVRPRTAEGNRTIREHVPVRHRFGDVVTTDVTREQYRALADHPGIAVRPVQRVRLLSDDLRIDWESPEDGDSVDGTVRIRLDVSNNDSDVVAVRWRVDGNDARDATYDPTLDAWTATWDASTAANGTHELFASVVTTNLATDEESITVAVGEPGQAAEPTIAWRSPGPGATVHEPTRIRIDARAPGGSVERVGWRIDDGDARFATFNESSGYWEDTLHPSAVPAGEHTLEARMETADGLARWATVEVTVDASVEPPRLEWQSPDDGDTVEGHLPIRLKANDSDGEVREVTWRVADREPRDTYFDSAVSRHYEDSWNTTAEEDGTYRLLATATDEDGAVTTRTITVAVDNSPEKPAVRWIEPAPGGPVANGVPIELAVGDEGHEITAVTWQVDGGPPRNASYNGDRDRWVAHWNASAVPTGVYELRASARTAAGGVGNATIEVAVDEPDGPDDGTSYGVDQLYGGTVAEPSGGAGIDVAVIDTGAATHPDLRGPLEACVTFVGGEPCSDPHGHGTALAGAAVADGGIHGVAPDADLHVYRAVGPNGTGHADDVAAAIHRAAERDVEIVVLGLRTAGPDSLVAREIAAHRGEVLVVAAAGNDGPATDTLAPPAAHEAVLGVGAIDIDRRVLDASSRGRAAGEFCACRGYIDVVAAGDGVATTGRHGGYRRATGTSIAAAQVAGVAAKGWASGRADLNRDGTVTPAEVRAWIRSHARDVVRGRNATEGYDPASGAGLPVVP